MFGNLLPWGNWLHILEQNSLSQKDNQKTLTFKLSLTTYNIHGDGFRFFWQSRQVEVKGSAFESLNEWWNNIVKMWNIHKCLWNSTEYNGRSPCWGILDLESAQLEPCVPSNVVEQLELFVQHFTVFQLFVPSTSIVFSFFLGLHGICVEISILAYWAVAVTIYHYREFLQVQITSQHLQTANWIPAGLLDPNEKPTTFRWHVVCSASFVISKSPTTSSPFGAPASLTRILTKQVSNPCKILSWERRPAQKRRDLQTAICYALLA